MKLRLNIVIILLMITSIIFIRCKEDDKQDQKMELPKIASVDPASAAPGAVVKINGSNFSEVIAENLVKFNGSVATVKSSTKTQLSVEVPAQATTGKVVVTVSGRTIDGPEFKVIQTPAITGISPEEGSAGTVVEISCANFSDISGYRILFNGKEATVQSATATKIAVEVPEGATTGKITITYDGKTIEGPIFTIEESLTPTISSIEPSKGKVGTVVVIKGTGFSLVAAENKVEFYGVTAEVSRATKTQLDVSVPEKATSGSIKITVNGKTTTGEHFTVVQTPIITGISPESGKAGTTVAITGTGLSMGKAVIFNGLQATVSSVTDDQIIVTVPEDASSGKISLTVEGSEDVMGPVFTVLPTLKVTRYWPNGAEVGDLIFILGEDFGDNISEVTVTINGAKLITDRINNQTHIWARIPSGTTSGQVYLTVRGETMHVGYFAIFKYQSFTDERNGENYKTITIGAQTWMVEDLAYDPGTANGSLSYCYGNNLDECEKGRYYNFEAAKKACPPGWHLPTDEEWKTLEKNLGMTEASANNLGWRGTNEGVKIAEMGESGINLQFRGYRIKSSEKDELLNSNKQGYYWTSTESAGEALYRSIYDASRTNSSEQIYREKVKNDGTYLYSVRCVKD